MPRLEALQAAPSFGSQLGAALGGGITQGISSTLQQMLKQKEETAADNQLIQQSFNRLAELSPQISYSPLPVGLHTEESAGDRAEFESQKTSLIAALRDKVNKGVLTNQKFRFIVRELLPSHGDRVAVKQRKLKAIGEQLGLDTGALGFSSEESEIYGKGKITLIDPKTGQSFYPSSLEDVKEAKKAGWKVKGE